MSASMRSSEGTTEVSHTAPHDAKSDQSSAPTIAKISEDVAEEPEHGSKEATSTAYNTTSPTIVSR